MLISPANTDRQDFTPDAFVAVECQEESGSEKVLHEPGKIPSVGVKTHEVIYRMHPDVNFVIASDVLPNAMAFGAASPSAGPQFHSEVIPEGYIVLRHVAVLPFEASLEPKRLAAAFNKTSPVAIVRNDSAIAVGFNVFGCIRSFGSSGINGRSSNQCHCCRNRSYHCDLRSRH